MKIKIKEAILEVTLKCNLRCIHCYASAGEINVKEPSTADFIYIIDRLEEMGIKKLTFVGGEPTIRKDFYEILQYAINKIPYVTVETNGTLENDLHNYNCSVVVSLEDCKPEYNDAIRGKGVFEKVITTLKRLPNNKAIRCTIYSDNDPLGVAILAEKLNANSIFIPLKPQGRGSVLYNKVPSRKRLIKVMRDIYLFNLYSYNTHIVDYPLYYIFNKELYSKYLDVFVNRGRICPAGIYRIFIDIKGNIHPCPFLPQFNLGNILKDDLDYIYKRIFMFNVFINSTPRAGKCSSCQYQNICDGGCIAEYIDYNKKIGKNCIMEVRTNGYTTR